MMTDCNTPSYEFLQLKGWQPDPSHFYYYRGSNLRQKRRDEKLQMITFNYQISINLLWCKTRAHKSKPTFMPKVGMFLGYKGTSSVSVIRYSMYFSSFHF